MNGYSRIRNFTKERSNPKNKNSSSISSVSTTKIPKPHQENTITTNYDDNNNNSKKNKDKEEEEEEISSADGEIFGVILSRKCSISSHSCTTNNNNNFLSEKQSSSSSSSSLASVNSALKRTLSSLRRSSSVSEGYCRIHHRSDPPANLYDYCYDHVLMPTSQSRSFNNKKKKGKIFNSCKRILGL